MTTPVGSQVAVPRGYRLLSIRTRTALRLYAVRPSDHHHHREAFTSSSPLRRSPHAYRNADASAQSRRAHAAVGSGALAHAAGGAAPQYNHRTPNTSPSVEMFRGFDSRRLHAELLSTEMTIENQLRHASPPAGAPTPRPGMKRSSRTARPAIANAEPPSAEAKIARLGEASEKNSRANGATRTRT
jgi:hypothetical protein